MRFSLPSLKYRLSTDCAFSFNRTLERLGHRAGVEDSAILPVEFFAHNESVKVSTLDLVPSPASVSEERAAREGAATGVGREFKVPVPDHQSL